MLTDALSEPDSLFSTLDWVGWATGIQLLTRVYPAWPDAGITR